jgi:ferredoxin
MVEERKRYILEFTDIPKERQSVNELPVEQRINNFNQVDLGFAEDAAVEEARRCLSCRRCLGCGLCLAECDKDAIDFGQADEMLDLSVDSVILTHGVERVR